MRYNGYAAFWNRFPLLGRRLHTLHCESCKPTGITLTIEYNGTTTNGKGTVHVRLYYGQRVKFPFTVRAGVIHAFGLRQNMRKPTNMRLPNGRSAAYGESGAMLLKTKGRKCRKGTRGDAASAGSRPVTR